MDPRDARKQRRQEQAREDILDATATVLLDRGLAGLTLAAVARELGLTKAALYYYFPSKDALVFELVYRALARQADVIEAAVAEAVSGAAAIEALIRASTAHFRKRKDELRLAYLVPQIGVGSIGPFRAEMLTKVRPFNDRMYGAVADKIAADQDSGLLSTSIDGRRLAFLAHTSVLGMLTLEGLVEVADVAPLIHTHDDMVDELVRTFRARLDRSSGPTPAR